MKPTPWLSRALPLITAAGAALAVVAVPRVARAQVEIHLSSKAADPKKPGAPSVQATVINGPAGVPADKFSLIESDAKPAPVTIKAKDVKTYVEGNETLAVVVLIEGHGLWMGNPDFSDAPGVLSKLGGAIDAVAKAGPPGSKGELIIYAQEPQVKVPMGDLGQLNGGARRGQGLQGDDPRAGRRRQPGLRRPVQGHLGAQGADRHRRRLRHQRRGGQGPAQGPQEEVRPGQDRRLRRLLPGREPRGRSVGDQEADPEHQDRQQHGQHRRPGGGDRREHRQPATTSRSRATTTSSRRASPGTARSTRSPSRSIRTRTTPGP